jgi:GNAT superfamily N-acetyltransferase
MISCGHFGLDPEAQPTSGLRQPTLYRRPKVPAKSAGSEARPRAQLAWGNQCEDGSMHPCVREARESDLDRIRQLIVDLASYERASHEVKTTTEQLRVALFGPQPAAYALVAENDNQVVGFALYFRNFSTWEGVHGIYLEDLYVMPEYRGSGLGRALLTSLAGLVVERGYARLEWAVLDWNQPAIDFYRSLGAVAMDEWTVYRLSGEALAAASAAA